MSAVAVALPRSAAVQAWAQGVEPSMRSIRNSLRNPTAYIPGLIFPLMLAAVYSAQFQRALGLPGFPEVDSFLDFILPASMLQSVAFGATAAGSDLALDIENGFFDRLLSSPVARPTILVGRLVGSAVEAALKFVILLAIFMVFGARVAGSWGAIVAFLMVSIVLAMAIGGMSLVLALRTGSQEAVNASFPLVFSVLFISSAFFPTELMTGWYRTVAELNPITWIIDPLRRLIIIGWDWSDALTAVGITTALAVATMAWATRALRARLASL